MLLSERHPLARVYAIRQHMQQLKHSYDGALHCGVMGDRNLTAEPRRLAERFCKEFERLLLTVIAGPLSSAAGSGRAPAQRAELS